jgi:sialate O-acetylesterase
MKSWKEAVVLSRPMILIAALSTVALAMVCEASAEVVLPKILGSHMVVQRALPVHVWGWANGGEPVSVTFRGESRATKANELGVWSIYLSPGTAGGPFEMTVQGTNSLRLEDVLVGDVWVASGQSNMEFEMRKASTAGEDLPKADNSKIRLMIVEKRTSDYPLTNLEASAWTASTPESAKEFSAVAWYFAREIEEREHVPIGVIDSTWGGTVAEAWTGMTALGQDPALAPVFAARGRMGDREATALLKNNLARTATEEARQKGLPAPQFPWHPLLSMWGPSMLWNAMIAPMTPFPIRGVIWYQGESNSPVERAPTYERLFRTMVEDWRRQWQIGDFPFLYVQLANFKSTPAEVWAPIREAQRKTLELRNTAMAVTIDVGNPTDVHPTDKRTVGHRLALAARALTYGEQVEYSGPLFRQATVENDALRVWFDHGDGLVSKGGSLSGFEIAGADGKFVDAEARVEGGTVVLRSSAVAEPLAGRYGWANNPECHLFNSAGLPASPFSTEN